MQINPKSTLHGIISWKLDMGSENFLGQNRGYWDLGIQIVWSNWANSRAFVYTMPKMEKIEKKCRLQVRKREYKMAIIDRKKITSRATKRWETSKTIIKVFEGNKYRKKKKVKNRKIELE